MIPKGLVKDVLTAVEWKRGYQKQLYVDVHKHIK